MGATGETGRNWENDGEWEDYCKDWGKLEDTGGTEGVQLGVKPAPGSCWGRGWIGSHWFELGVP